MATGLSKTKWNGELKVSKIPPFSRSSIFDVTLSYPGKKEVQEILDGSIAQTTSFWQSESPLASENQLFFGDNLEIMRKLLHNSDVRGKVRLIYIDPPFSTNSVFQSSKQKDAYYDLLQGAEYLEYIRERLVVLRELLADDGSIYIHLDANMAFEVKILMDEIFGKLNFRNWITRKKCSTKNTTRNQYGNISDYILFYTKSSNYVWNRSFDPWPKEKILKEYPCIDPETGRRYKKVPIHAPGVRNGETGQSWRGMMPPKGKHWQLTPSKLDELDAKGEIYWSSTNNPRRKVFFNPDTGIPKQDIWLEHRDSINQNMKLTGYPTEKNLQMLESIVQASSNPGDLVLDCFSGSGTTLHAAFLHERNWIGIDNSFEAICCTLHRFHMGLEAIGDFVTPNQEQCAVSELLKPTCFTSSILQRCPFTLEVQDSFLEFAKKGFNVNAS